MSEDSSSKRRKKSTQNKGKRKRRKESPTVKLVLENEECLRLKIDKKLVEEFKLAGRSDFPKSLMSYVGDRDELLEEVFTILSKEDIKGLLPDILKGLKMKKIKSLCRHQLAQLDQSVLERVINGEQESVLPPHELESSNHEDICDVLEVTPPTDHCQEPTNFSDISDNEEGNRRKQQKADTSVILEAEIDTNLCESTDSDVPGENGPEPEDVIAISPPIMDEVDVELAGVKSMQETRCTLSPQQHMLVRKREVKIANKEGSSVVKPRQYHHSNSLPVARENSVSLSSTESELREKLLLKAKCRELLQGQTDKKSVLNPTTLELEMKEKALRSLLMKTVRKPQTT